MSERLRLLLVFLGLALTAMFLLLRCEDSAIHPVQQPLKHHNEPQSLQEVFDELDQSVNEGRGYKDYLNPDGFPTGALLAWSESYLMQAYADMFRATGDKHYLYKLFDHIKSVIHNRDDFRGQRDYKGDLVPAWGTNRYAKGGEWLHFVVHTGMITYPMLEFVHLVKERDIEELQEDAEIVLSRVKESVDYHDREWVILQKSGFGLYTYPEDFYQKSNYVVPLSQQAAIGRSLILLWKLTGERRYYERARDIALGIKSSLHEAEWDGYVWGVHIGPLSDRNPMGDISHATITVDFIRLAYEHGIVFNSNDMRKIVSTIKRLLQDGRAERYIDGTGDYAYEITAGQYAMLAPYEPEIWERCYNILFGIYRVEITGHLFQEDWWETVMLGIARLAHYAEVSAYGSKAKNR